MKLSILKVLCLEISMSLFFEDNSIMVTSSKYNLKKSTQPPFKSKVSNFLKECNIGISFRKVLFSES